MKDFAISTVIITIIYLFGLEPTLCTESEYDCRSKKTCGSCLATGPYCAFCVSREYDTYNLPRCDLIQNHDACPEGELVNPKGTLQTTKDDPFKDFDPTDVPIQIQPQEIKLNVRANEPQTFNLTFKMTENYPVDLYFLMDLSYSMRDDKEKLAELGDQIVEMLRNITETITIGFGSFVDKTVVPYVNPLDSPCTECTAPYGFKHHLRLNSNITRFVQEIRSARISENIDSSEGGFDALMQAVICKSEIGWRTYSRRIILFITDAESHSAGDGKLGGIVVPNDGTCHMNADGDYTQSLHQDYPSLSQIANAAKDNNINVIFAVTEQQVTVYKQISEFIPGSETGRLDSDSANIVNLVKHNYEKITSKLTLVPSDNENITIRIYSQCKGNISEETNICEDLKIGDSVTFDIEIAVTNCPEDPQFFERTIEFKPIGLPDILRVNISLICECDCEKGVGPIRHSLRCSSQGTEKCGVCYCDSGFYGKQCECSNVNLTSVNQQLQCIAPNSTSICSNRGECFCGTCDCFSRNNDPSQRYSGAWCQCDDYDCPFYNSKICGGASHGVCNCGKCNCTEEYSGDECGCTTSTDTCLAAGNSPGGICNGQGSCVCGRCNCFQNSTYRGPTCEECQYCNEVCRKYKDCVECIVHQTGIYNKEDCDINCRYDLNISVVNKLPEKLRRCQFKDVDSCIFYFTYKYGENDDLQILALKERDCNIAVQVNTLAIALGLVCGIVLVAIALLIIWKIFTTIIDKRELHMFLQEKEKAQWETLGNPLYKEPQKKYENPLFGKEPGKRQ